MSITAATIPSFVRYIAVPRDLLAVQELSLTEKILYSYLLDAVIAQTHVRRLDPNEEIRLTYNLNTLGNIVGCSRNTVTASLKKLVEAGLIIMVRHSQSFDILVNDYHEVLESSDATAVNPKNCDSQKECPANHKNCASREEHTRYNTTNLSNHSSSVPTAPKMMMSDKRVDTGIAREAAKIQVGYDHIRERYPEHSALLSAIVNVIGDINAATGTVDTPNGSMSASELQAKLASFDEVKVVAILKRVSERGIRPGNPERFAMTCILNECSRKTINAEPAPKKTNLFNDFNQRSYTAEQWKEIEKRMYARRA